MGNIQTGIIIKIVGCEIKNDNGVFEVSNVWEEEFSCYKLKKNGERIKSKYACNIFGFSFFNQYGSIINKEDIPAAITEVNKSLKERNKNEVVYSYIPVESQELFKGCFIQVVKYIPLTVCSGVPSGFIYTLHAIKGNNSNSHVLNRIGQKGQELSILVNNNCISFSEKTMQQLFNEGYICIVEQVTQIRKEMEQTENETVTNEEQSQLETVEISETKEVIEAVEAQPKQTEITATIDENGYIVLSNERARELDMKFVHNKATEQEEKLLRDYHLQLQERAMSFHETLPSNYEELINNDKIYKIVSAFGNDHSSAGIYEIEVTGKDLKFPLLWRKTDVLNIITPLEEQPTNSIPQTEEQTTQEPDNNGIEFEIVLNKEHNGIELHFTDKPEEAIREQLKANGFRWSRQGFWYTKQSEQRLTFVKSLQSNNSEPTVKEEPISYPEINIDDISLYVVSKQLQQAEHNANWIFRKNEKDRTQEIQSLFQEYTDKVKEIISKTENEKIIYHLKKDLQYFKKHYFENFVKQLQHKANNPSWAVTGRAGVNARRYNKMADRYDNLMRESISVHDEFRRRLDCAELTIHRDDVEQVKKQITERVNNTSLELTFVTETKEITLHRVTEKLRTYNSHGYTIAKSWGMFRIFDQNMNEIQTTLNTTSKLSDAKNYVVYLVQQSKNEERQAI